MVKITPEKLLKMDDYTLVRTREEATEFYILHAIKGSGFTLILYILGSVIGTGEKATEMGLFGGVIYCSIICFNLVEARIRPKVMPTKLNMLPWDLLKWRAFCIIPTFLGFLTPVVGMLPVAWVSMQRFGENARMPGEAVTSAGADAPKDEVAQAPASAPPTPQAAAPEATAPEASTVTPAAITPAAVALTPTVAAQDNPAPAATPTQPAPQQQPAPQPAQPAAAATQASHISSEPPKPATTPPQQAPQAGAAPSAEEAEPKPPSAPSQPTPAKPESDF